MAVIKAVAKEIAWTWSGKTVEVGMERLGSGPTVLLLPALSSISTRKEMWPLQIRLASAYETNSVDWPGFGDRPKPEIDWRPEAYAAFLDHLVSHVVPQPFATCAAGHASAYVLAQAAAASGSMGRLKLRTRIDCLASAIRVDLSGAFGSTMWLRTKLQRPSKMGCSLSHCLSR